MIRGILVIVGLFLLLSACTQRVICPAYQSSFIYDQEALRQKFSYFKEDSTPKILTASTAKSRYLIAVPESYRKKFRRMQTVEMKPVYPVIPDSLKTQDTDVLMAERDVNDSTNSKAESIDSVYAITKTKEKYNLDQDLYMWYFREVLVLPDVRAALENKDKKKDNGETPPDSVQKKGADDHRGRNRHVERAHAVGEWNSYLLIGARGYLVGHARAFAAEKQCVAGLIGDGRVGLRGLRRCQD